ncbi:MAG: molybdenum cofactor biosynthesis protein MoaB [Planctomycetes bacterium]|nr:molybdenum cofactor biosynthesis protein MoaB [Planctomycetota bacterium]
MSVEGHQAAAAEAETIRVALRVTTDSRTAATDETGRLAAELLAKAGFSVDGPALVSNDPATLRRAIREALLGTADVVLLSGGTGLGRRDGTVEAVSEVIAKRLDGFGEAFRALSFAEIGPAAILTRALLGSTVEGKIVVCTPGSPNAMRLALERLLLPELPHLVREARR